MTTRRSFITGLISFLALTQVHADCLQWAQTANGTYVCMFDDLVNRNPIVRLVPAPGVPTTSAAPLPKCDDGWTLVLDTGGQPMCARELRKPR